MLECVPSNLTSDRRLDYEANVSDAVVLLPKLQTGIDVNVKFSGVSEFEYTSECIIFDLFNIALYHGWLVDPQVNSNILDQGKHILNVFLSARRGCQSCGWPELQSTCGENHIE